MLLELGMTEPESEPVDSVHGTTMVVRTLTVVTGMLVATAPAFVDAAASEVIVLAQVTIAGLEDTYAAQIPWK